MTVISISRGEWLDLMRKMVKGKIILSQEYQERHPDKANKAACILLLIKESQETFDEIVANPDWTHIEFMQGDDIGKLQVTLVDVTPAIKKLFE